MLKRILLISLIALGINNLAFAQNDTSQSKDPYEWSSKVNEVNGVGLYILAEPLRDYKILNTFTIDITNGQINSFHFSQFRNILRFKAMEMKKKYPDADGLLTMNGSKIKIISYTDDVERLALISNVKTIEEKQAYIWSEALKVNKKAFGVKFSGEMPVERKFLEKWLKKMVEKAKSIAENKEKEFDAIVINEGKIKAIRYINP